MCPVMLAEADEFKLCGHIHELIFEEKNFSHLSLIGCETIQTLPAIMRAQLEKLIT